MRAEGRWNGSDQGEEGGGGDHGVRVASHKVAEERADEHVLGQQHHGHVEHDDAGDKEPGRWAEPAVLGRRPFESEFEAGGLGGLMRDL